MVSPEISNESLAQRLIKKNKNLSAYFIRISNAAANIMPFFYLINPARTNSIRYLTITCVAHYYICSVELGERVWHSADVKLTLNGKG